MRTATFSTSGMHCPSCSMLIELNVSDIEGVDSVKASHADGITVVTFDESLTDCATIESAIREAGFEPIVQS